MYLCVSVHVIYKGNLLSRLMECSLLCVSIYTLPIKQRKTTQYKKSKFFRVHLKQMNFLSDITYFYIFLKFSSKIIRISDL